MTSILIDFLILMILGFCVWQGHRKGFILSAASILIFFLAIWGGGQIANRFTDTAADSIAPFLQWVTEDASDEAQRENNTSPEKSDRNLAEKTFEKLGISSKEVNGMVDSVVKQVAETGESVKTTISSVFVKTLTRVILFIFGFIIISLLLTLVAHFISMVFSLPGLKFLDKVGGLALGGLYGLLVMFAVGWMIRFLGILIPADIINGTFLLKFFINANPIAWLL